MWSGDWWLKAVGSLTASATLGRGEEDEDEEEIPNERIATFLCYC
jgi:hypothetical protein